MKYHEDMARKISKKEGLSLIVKQRQVGATTMLAAYACWLAKDGRRILYVGHNMEIAKRFLDVCMTICSYSNINVLARDRRSKIEVVPQKGEILAVSGNPNAGKGESVDFVIFDEADFIKGLEEIWTGLRPCLSSGSKAIMVSSPNVPGNSFFERMCKKNGMVSIVPWSALI
jgi:phage FluMu gp28-like protein